MSIAEPINRETLEHCAKALRVLAHPDRLAAVEVLGREKLTVGELADRLGLAPAALSQHLSLMAAHGLVEARRDGRAAYYRCTNPHALAVIRCIRREMRHH